MPASEFKISECINDIKSTTELVQGMTDHVLSIWNVYSGVVALVLGLVFASDSLSSRPSARRGLLVAFALFAAGNLYVLQRAANYNWLMHQKLVQMAPPNSALASALIKSMPSEPCWVMIFHILLSVFVVLVILRPTLHFDFGRRGKRGDKSL